ncbi:DUF1471 domain-containing protein [Pantoea sp. FN0307]|uniref:DUF1471 domain-containing protein n=1 Tax=unclassified Pantoea TaxID=2630326 RepID=UPI003CE7DA39
MKSIKNFVADSAVSLVKNAVAVSVLSLISFGGFAQSISATAATLDSAEAKIAAQAVQAGASYKITGARVNNGAYVTAVLSK